jgi:hypothetical protein
VAPVAVALLALAACGDDIQLDRSSLQDLYGTDNKHADCIADRLEDLYSDAEIEDIDREVRAIENHEKAPEEASELFQRFEDDLHAAATECGVRTGTEVDPTTTAPAATDTTTAATATTGA